VLSISLCLVVGIYIMYETKAFWGKESNSNINTLNCSMNFMSSTNLLPVVITIVVAALAIGMLMTTRAGFG
jgi:hypothetical protein